MVATPIFGPLAPLLVVIPNVGMAVDKHRVFLDVKATEGLVLYARFWPGKVRCVCREIDPAEIAFGRWYERSELPFDLQMVAARAEAPALIPHLEDAAVVLAGADSHLDLGLAQLLTDIPLVFTIELTLRTRIDIVRLGPDALFRKLRTILWLLRLAKERRHALRLAAGIQANGLPAYNAYWAASPSCLLYYDTRLSKGDFIGRDGADAKAKNLADRKPLRLAFTGRFEPIKGVDDLVRVVAAVRRRGNARVVLDIFGKGSRYAAMAAAIKRERLEDWIRLHDPLDFDGELVPMLKRDVDLFLCCHGQGDPSCTYLETLGCGVPILGYKNAAFKGLLKLGGGCVGVPIGDVEAMASEIERLDTNRSVLRDHIRAAAEMAEPHLFETVFEARTRHLTIVAGLAPIV